MEQRSGISYYAKRTLRVIWFLFNHAEGIAFRDFAYHAEGTQLFVHYRIISIQDTFSRLFITIS